LKNISGKLLHWYSSNYRNLPWRQTKDPYRIWLSEIILQQTRVSQGMPYYSKFVEKYPKLQNLAEARLDDVLKLWQGLGYYSRARNMHTCAKTIIKEFDGKFPDSFDQLHKLKGVGKYTAAAIASICFHEAVPSIDGNVYRVISRIFGIYNDISKSASYKVFFEKVKKIIPSRDPGVFNQALMELGALICLPKNPKCEACPLRVYCFAHLKSVQHDLPVKSNKVKIKHRNLDYYIFRDGHEILIRQRGPGDIWNGLFEFYLHESTETNFVNNFIITNISKLYTHRLTHQKLIIRFILSHVSSEDLQFLSQNLNMIKIDISKLGNYAVPKPIELYLKNEYLLLN
jgi:A/G-specific adenine glycosylase